LVQGSAVARRYAQALFQAAQGLKATVEVGHDLKTAVAAIWDDERLRAFMTGDGVAAEAKKRLVAGLAEAVGAAGPVKGSPGGPSQGEARGLHHLVRNFLWLTVDKRREAYVPEMARAYQALVDRAEGLVDIEVRTAVELGEDGRSKLGAVLTGKLGRRVRANFVVDPSLIGGLQVRVDDSLFDASLRRRLVRLGEHLAKARVGV
jgi:F-type H+-transporting ATPase subunit delta